MTRGTIVLHHPDSGRTATIGPDGVEYAYPNGRTIRTPLTWTPRKDAAHLCKQGFERQRRD